MRAKLPTQAKSSRSAPRRRPGPSETGPTEEPSPRLEPLGGGRDIDSGAESGTRRAEEAVQLQHLVGNQAVQRWTSTPLPRREETLDGSPSPAAGLRVTAGAVVQRQERFETEDGVWELSDYGLQGRGWRGLREHTLTYLPRGGVGERNIALVQAVSSQIEGQNVFTSDVQEQRTSPATGFRIDTLVESNNPIFGTEGTLGSLAETPLEGDTYQIGRRVNRGTRGRPNFQELAARRLDNPGFQVRDLERQNLLDASMGQTFITAAYDLNTGEYLGSIGYGWAQDEGGEPLLMEVSHTTGGVGELFRSAVEQWNLGRTGGRQNLRLPTPEAVEVRGFGEEEDDDGDLAMEEVGPGLEIGDVGEDIGGLGLEAEGWAMDESSEEEPGIDYPTWLGRIEVLFRAEYRASLDDYPDQPYRLGYHEGLTPEAFYQAYLARGRAF